MGAGAEEAVIHPHASGCAEEAAEQGAPEAATACAADGVPLRIHALAVVAAISPAEEGADEADGEPGDEAEDDEREDAAEAEAAAA